MPTVNDDKSEEAHVIKKLNTREVMKLQVHMN